MTLKAIIVDDEKQSRISLKGDLDTYCPQVEVIGEAGSVKEALELIPELDPALLFLDIQLGDGTGFNILEQLEENEKAAWFEFEEDKMYSQRESELIQQYLQEHGEMPGGGDDELDDLF